MTKEQFFHSVQYDHGNILYSMYKEKFDEKKHKLFLQPQEFMMYIQMSGRLNEYFELACKYYERKFGINKLYSKDGKLVRFI